MKALRLLATALGVLLISGVAAPAEEEWKGPTFELRNLEGEEVTEADVFSGGTLYLVDFWASWCRPCNQYLPHLEAMVEEYGERGLKVVIFCVDDSSTMSTARQHLAGEDYPFTILFDPESDVKSQLGVRRIPTTVLFSPSGEELWRHVGYESGTENTVREKIEANLPPEN